MMNKLKSRKLWMAIGSVVSILIADFVGVDVDPAAVAGLAAIVGTYLIGQGIVDKAVVTEQVKVAGDVGRAQLELYARNLENQLKEIERMAEMQEAAAGLASISAAPELPFQVGPPLEDPTP